MSDLKDQAADQPAPPSSRIGPENRLRRDRAGRFPDHFWGLVPAICVLASSCVSTPPPVTPSAEVHRPEVWVDAFSPAGGDGSSARPFKNVPQPLPDGVTVRLRAGLYAGPFVLGEGARLEGTGEVVLTGEAGQTVVTATSATLEGLSVQGGALGLEANGKTVVKRVHFSGQRQRAALVRGRLELSSSTFDASVEGIEGIFVERGATLKLDQAKFTGGFKRAVLTDGGTLELEALTGEGPKTLVHALGGQSTLRGVKAVMGSGAALLFSGGTVDLRGAEVVGHEYALQLMGGVKAQLSELQFRGATQACISSIGSAFTLTNAALQKCGGGGALTLQKSMATLTGVRIEEAQELGIFMKQGELKLERVEIAQVSAAHDGALGDALHVRDEAKVSAVGPLTVSDVAGSALFASTYSEVNLPSLSVERARSSALFVELHAQVNIETLLVRGGSGPAVVVPDKASVTVKTLSVAGGNEMPVYAECTAGAQVSVGRLESTLQQLPSKCVSLPK